MSPEQRLANLGITLPPPPPPAANYCTFVEAGTLALTSGQLPYQDGQLIYQGRVGAEVTAEQAYQACKLSTINAIAQLKHGLGELSRIKRIMRLECVLQTIENFHEHPPILDGASDLLMEVFGGKGKHTRTAMGIHDMPLNAATQIRLWAYIEPSTEE